ncbi:SDR family oxidoreductase [Glaciecola sp. MH2013]|uniref:SDR family NAD(P)-dependent oxidoreductase n=1 Tax=Glaciecola sp. MH2013 TaxID=2785524 RepID=UPI00189CD794|nr:SDR family oxidoreductase [Glaciecola sp. MH2013]MBF7073023.1 SDR family oxidoreductase [Glaciecola sp. MH2013]
MDSLLDFTNKTAIITGAANGFGRLLAKELNKRACNLVLSDINQAGLDETLATLMQPNNARTLVADVQHESSAKALVELACSEFGQLDIAVNNAGIAHEMAATHELTEEIFDQQFAVNVKGVAFGMKYQIPAMLKAGHGHILNVSSLAGLGGAPKAGAYVAAKHAVAGITKTAAVEYARYNIQTNAICPFFSPTNIMDVEGLNSEEIRATLAKGTPMKRLGDPQEMVNVMLLLLSPGNTYMNGQTIAVDGGVTSW